MKPLNPYVAVTHSNPYPYYADLVAQKPLYYEESLGFWVASSAETVTAVLTSEVCRVRPLSEPVPTVLLGSTAAIIFQNLPRMTDGESHCPLKKAVSSALDLISLNHVAEQSEKWAQVLVEAFGQDDMRRLTDFAFQLPVYVVAEMLGVPKDQLSTTAVCVDEFVRCMTLVGTAEEIEKGKVSAGCLFEMIESILKTQQPDSNHRILPDLDQELKRYGSDRKTILVANAVGFLFQVYEATAGLIGNSLVALSNNSDLREQLKAEPFLISNFIDEVARYDPSAQMTRRFVAQDGVVAGQNMKEGDTILVLFAAANRDPALNPHPERFDINRKDRRSFTFGHGIHACPAESIGKSIAGAGIETMLNTELDIAGLAEKAHYRESLTLRIPLFD